MANPPVRPEGDATWDPAGGANASPAHGRQDGPPQGRAPAERGEDYRTLALLAWVLLLAGLFTFIGGVAAVVVAYVKRSDAPPLWQSHFSAIIRMFWIWLALTIIGAPLILLFGLGYLVMGAATIWTAAVGVLGLLRASENRAP